MAWSTYSTILLLISVFTPDYNPMTDQPIPTLEQKLIRLKEIQQMLESKSVPLSQSMTLLEEALNLKKQIEKELKSMENKILDLTKEDE